MSNVIDFKAYKAKLPPTPEALEAYVREVWSADPSKLMVIANEWEDLARKEMTKDLAMKGFVVVRMVYDAFQTEAVYDWAVSWVEVLEDFMVRNGP